MLDDVIFGRARLLAITGVHHKPIRLLSSLVHKFYTSAFWDDWERWLS
jgi:hypothetical protein